jgi:hypothetical protein
MAKTDAFGATFKKLRALFKPYEKQLAVIADKPGRYYLGTKTSKTKSGAVIWFGGVEIKKNYVSFHFVPVYMNPALMKDASPSLLKRKQGKGCFNFTEADPAHVKELTAIVKRGFAVFIERFS